MKVVRDEWNVRIQREPEEGQYQIVKLEEEA